MTWKIKPSIAWISLVFMNFCVYPSDSELDSESLVKNINKISYTSPNCRFGQYEIPTFCTPESTEIVPNIKGETEVGKPFPFQRTDDNCVILVRTLDKDFSGQKIYGNNCISLEQTPRIYEFDNWKRLKSIKECYPLTDWWMRFSNGTLEISSLGFLHNTHYPLTNLNMWSVARAELKYTKLPNITTLIFPANVAGVLLNGGELINAGIAHVPWIAVKCCGELTSDQKTALDNALCMLNPKRLVIAPELSRNVIPITAQLGEINYSKLPDGVQITIMLTQHLNYELYQVLYAAIRDFFANIELPTDATCQIAEERRQRTHGAYLCKFLWNIRHSCNIC